MRFHFLHPWQLEPPSLGMNVNSTMPRRKLGKLTALRKRRNRWRLCLVAALIWMITDQWAWPFISDHQILIRLPLTPNWRSGSILKNFLQDISAITHSQEWEGQMDKPKKKNFKKLQLVETHMLGCISYNTSGVRALLSVVWLESRTCVKPSSFLTTMSRNLQLLSFCRTLYRSRLSNT